LSNIKKSQGVIALWENGLSALKMMGLQPDKGVTMKTSYFSRRNSTGVIERANNNIIGAFTPWSRVQDYLVTQIPDAEEEWLKCNSKVSQLAVFHSKSSIYITL
jgi:hypothetical protein